MRGGEAVRFFNRRTKRRPDSSYHELEPLGRLFLAVKGGKRIFSFLWRATGGQTDLFQGGQTDLFIFMAGGGIEHVVLNKICCALTDLLMP